MLSHNYENLSEDIIEYLLEHEGDDLEDAIAAIYGENVRFSDLPEEYVLDIHKELFQCFNCAVWFVPNDVNKEIGICNECSNETKENI